LNFYFKGAYTESEFIKLASASSLYSLFMSRKRPKLSGAIFMAKFELDDDVGAAPPTISLVECDGVYCFHLHGKIAFFEMRMSSWGCWSLPPSNCMIELRCMFPKSKEVRLPWRGVRLSSLLAALPARRVRRPGTYERIFLRADACLEPGLKRIESWLRSISSPQTPPLLDPFAEICDGPITIEP